MRHEASAAVPATGSPPARRCSMYNTDSLYRSPYVWLRAQQRNLVLALAAYKRKIGRKVYPISFSMFDQGRAEPPAPGTIGVHSDA